MQRSLQPIDARPLINARMFHITDVLLRVPTVDAVRFENTRQRSIVNTTQTNTSKIGYCSTL